MPKTRTKSSPILKHILELQKQTLNSYKAKPSQITEHANHERITATGGYGRRQLYELVQNASDAMIGAKGIKSGRVEICLTEDALYCANEGYPISTKGIDAMTSSYMSPKTRPRSDQKPSQICSKPFPKLFKIHRGFWPQGV